jgi:hypothetical protein
MGTVTPLRRHYQVRPTSSGRWAVVHRVPGTHDWAVDVDCPSASSAEREAQALERARLFERTQRRA